LVLTLEEKADYAVIDDKAARERARFMGLNVIGTLRVLRLMFDADLIDKREFLRALDDLKQFDFRISDKVIEKVKERL
jgi:predicted nucleic acid-binding protein